MRESCADLDRQAGEAFGERAEMLARQQRRRHHHGDLRAGHRGDEGGAQRHLGLAEADIAADQPVHRPAATPGPPARRRWRATGPRSRRTGSGRRTRPRCLRAGAMICGVARSCRAAAMRISSPAMSRMRCFIRALRVCQRGAAQLVERDALRSRCRSATAPRCSRPAGTAFRRRRRSGAGSRAARR